MTLLFKGFNKNSLSPNTWINILSFRFISTDFSYFSAQKLCWLPPSSSWWFLFSWREYQISNNVKIASLSNVFFPISLNWVHENRCLSIFLLSRVRDENQSNLISIYSTIFHFRFIIHRCEKTFVRRRSQVHFKLYILINSFIA